MNQIIITCVLDNKRKLMRICPDQYPYSELNVSISSADLDRKAINIGDKFVIDGDKLKFVEDYNYYTYRGEVKGMETYKIQESFKTQIEKLIGDKCPSVKTNGFYLAPEKFQLLVRNIKKGINTMLLGATGTGKTQSIQLIFILSCIFYYVFYKTYITYITYIFAYLHIFSPQIGTFPSKKHILIMHKIYIFYIFI